MNRCPDKTRRIGHHRSALSAYGQWILNSRIHFGILNSLLTIAFDDNLLIGFIECNSELVEEPFSSYQCWCEII